MTPSPSQPGEVSGHSQVLQGHSPSQAISVLLQAALHLFSYVSPSTPHTGANSSMHSHFGGQGHSCSHSGSTLNVQFEPFECYHSSHGFRCLSFSDFNIFLQNGLKLNTCAHSNSHMFPYVTPSVPQHGV